MTQRAHACGLATCLLLGACQAQGPGGSDTALQPTRLYASAQCGTEQASLRVLASAAELSRSLNAGDTLGAPPKAVAADFSRQTVLQLSLGQQPSAGAGVDITSASVDATGQRLTLKALWQLPDPNRMQAMVVTRPCVIFSLPRGDYRSARVLDQQGQQRVATDLTR